MKNKVVRFGDLLKWFPRPPTIINGLVFLFHSNSNSPETRPLTLKSQHVKLWNLFFPSTEEWWWESKEARKKIRETLENKIQGETRLRKKSFYHAKKQKVWTTNRNGKVEYISGSSPDEWLQIRTEICTNAGRWICSQIRSGIFDYSKLFLCVVSSRKVFIFEVMNEKDFAKIKKIVGS